MIGAFPPLQGLLKELLEDGGIAVDLVACAKDQRDRPFAAEFYQLVDGHRLLSEFFAVTFAKYTPSIHVVTIPTAKRGARRDLLEPNIDSRFLLSQATGPQSVNQYAKAVDPTGTLICAF